MNTLLVGNPKTFAIESFISQPFESLGQRALGYYCLYIGGQVYGVRSAEATLLACSYDEVVHRLTRRGTHLLSLACAAHAQEVARAVQVALYEDLPDDTIVCGMSCARLRTELASCEIVFAPDGDAAFDDGSHVLQFDQNEQVRLVAFKTTDDPIVKVGSVVDITLSADEFYQTLEQWKNHFNAEWYEALARKSR